MKPFDLEAALAGAPVVTRNNEKIIRLVHVPEVKASNARLLSVTEAGNINLTSECGRYYDEDRAYYADLFMASTQVTMWINIYRHSHCAPYTGELYDNEYQAVGEGKEIRDYIATAPVTWEE